MPWAVGLSNEQILRKIDTNKGIILRIKKRRSEFLEHIMKKWGLENLTQRKIETWEGNNFFVFVF